MKRNNFLYEEFSDKVLNKAVKQATREVKDLQKDFADTGFTDMEMLKKLLRRARLINVFNNAIILHNNKIANETRGKLKEIIKKYNRPFRIANCFTFTPLFMLHTSFHNDTAPKNDIVDPTQWNSLCVLTIREIFSTALRTDEMKRKLENDCGLPDGTLVESRIYENFFDNAEEIEATIHPFIPISLIDNALMELNSAIMDDLTSLNIGFVHKTNSSGYGFKNKNIISFIKYNDVIELIFSKGLVNKYNYFANVTSTQLNTTSSKNAYHKKTYSRKIDFNEI